MNSVQNTAVEDFEFFESLVKSEFVKDGNVLTRPNHSKYKAKIDELDVETFQLVERLYCKYLDPLIEQTLAEGNNKTITIPVKVIKDYINELEVALLHRINNLDKIRKQLFLLFCTTKLLNYYNMVKYKLPIARFRQIIYYPLTLYMLVRFFPETRRFLHSTIKDVFIDVKKRNPYLIRRFTQYYYLDEELIRSDMLFDFLQSGLYKRNPLIVKNLDHFYKNIFRYVLFYYFKNVHQFHFKPYQDLVLDTLIAAEKKKDDFSIYRNIMQKLQVEKIMQESPSLSQLKYNYEIFRNLILNNEFQNILLDTNEATSKIYHAHDYKIIKIYHFDKTDYPLLKKIRKLPTIYELLKSVHIYTTLSKSSTSKNSQSKKLIKETVLEKLLLYYYEIVNVRDFREILERVAANFVDSIFTGEYINLLTLSPVKIKVDDLNIELRKFIDICFENSEENDDNDD